MNVRISQKSFELKWSHAKKMHLQKIELIRVFWYSHIWQFLSNDFYIYFWSAKGVGMWLIYYDPI